MRISRASALLSGIAGMAVLGAGLPALGQDKKGPESLLPPGFNEPVATPTPAPTASGAPRGPGAAPIVPPGAMVQPLPSDTPTPIPTPSATPTIDADMLARYEMPPSARRSLAMVGLAGPADGALGPDAFGRTNGQFLEGLMRRLDAPIASRWISIGLRRALAAKIATPPAVNGADFAAERAWLLLRMGEAVAARDVVQSVDNANYTPKLYQMAMQTALANGDPAELCPLADTGLAATQERGWVLAQAMCAGLSGMPVKVGPMFKAASRNNVASGIDLLLAQKVAGAGAAGRQAVTIEWDDVDHLTAWRYGLAQASGTDIPDTLVAGASPNVLSWRALSPGLAPAVRARFADYAAARGVLSSAAMVDLYGSILGDDDAQSTAEAGVARDLRTAYEGADAKARLDALRQLWDEPKTRDAQYARLILTARAAARIPAGTGGADIDRLVAAMLTAGLDMPALRWRNAAGRGSDAWAMLTIVDPARPTLRYADVGAYSGKDPDGLKRKMLFAALAGLGRIPADEVDKGAQALDVRIGQQNAWTRALAQAALARQPGTVLLLAGVGMQTKVWRGVSPEAMFHIIVALRAAGLDGIARMVGAEAIARA